MNTEQEVEMTESATENVLHPPFLALECHKASSLVRMGEYNNETMEYPPSIPYLLGKTIIEIIVISEDGEKRILRMRMSDGEVLELSHQKDGLEDVYIESIVGDLNDLLNTPILKAEQASQKSDTSPEGSREESATWTFYKLATIKGYVDIRFFGSSTGYYSEDAELYQCTPWVPRLSDDFTAERYYSEVGNRSLLDSETPKYLNNVIRAVDDPIYFGSMCWVPMRSGNAGSWSRKKFLKKHQRRKLYKFGKKTNQSW